MQNEATEPTTMQSLDSASKRERAICGRCNTPFERFSCMLGDAPIFVQKICGRCIHIQNEESGKRRALERKDERDIKWLKICPASYRDTDIDDSRLSPTAVNMVVNWSPKSSRGIGLIGETGAGKTRCLFWALRQAFEAGRECYAISHNRFSRVAMDAYSGTTEERGAAREMLSYAKHAHVLLIDDLGKPPSTERADSELEELVEYRTSQGLPILWSANGSGQWLIDRLGRDRGEPLFRRLAEFCDIRNMKELL